MSNFIEIELTNLDHELEKITINIDKVNMIYRYPEKDTIEIIFDNGSSSSIQFNNSEEYHSAMVKIRNSTKT